MPIRPNISRLKNGLSRLRCKMNLPSVPSTGKVGGDMAACSSQNNLDNATAPEIEDHRAADPAVSHCAAATASITQPATPTPEPSLCHNSVQADQITDEETTASSLGESGVGSESKLDDGIVTGAEGRAKLSSRSSSSVKTSDLISELQNGTLLSYLTQVYETYFPPGRARIIGPNSTSSSSSSSSGSSTGDLSYKFPNEYPLVDQVSKNGSVLGPQCLDSPVLGHGQVNSKNKKKNNKINGNTQDDHICPKAYEKVNSSMNKSKIDNNSTDKILGWMNKLPDCTTSFLPATDLRTPPRRVRRKLKMSNLRSIESSAMYHSSTLI